MQKAYDFTPLQETLRSGGLKEITDALDSVLFMACMQCLDVEHRGVPSDTDANQIYLVRLLLDDLRKMDV